MSINYEAPLSATSPFSCYFTHFGPNILLRTLFSNTGGYSSKIIAKNLSNYTIQFKSVLKNYLHAHYFYSVDEYFNVNRE
jgi:hypothetical protein